MRMVGAAHVDERIGSGKLFVDVEGGRALVGDGALFSPVSMMWVRRLGDEHVARRGDEKTPMSGNRFIDLT